MMDYCPEIQTAVCADQNTSLLISDTMSVLYTNMLTSYFIYIAYLFNFSY